MTAVPTPQELVELDDEEIASLAASWRVRAGHGQREAFGVAHALEVERRRRLRESQLHQLQPLAPEPVPVRPWWKFWRSNAGAGPMSRT